MKSGAALHGLLGETESRCEEVLLQVDDAALKVLGIFILILQPASESVRRPIAAESGDSPSDIVATAAAAR